MNMALQNQVKAISIPASVSTPVQNRLLQRKCPNCSTHSIDGEREEDQKKRLNLQRRSTNESGPDMVPPIVHDVLRSPGEPLPQEIQAYMEPRFGHDFSKVRVQGAGKQLSPARLMIGDSGDIHELEAEKWAEKIMGLSEPAKSDIPSQHFRHDLSRVRIHTDTKAVESAQMMNARAYTVGNDIVFGHGQYQPASVHGQRLLAHELVHVIQQNHDANVPSLQRAETDEEVGCALLKNSDSDFNNKINTELTNAVNAVGKPIDAEKVIDKVESNLGGWYPVSPIEDWAEKNLPPDKIKQPLKGETKYKGMTAAFWPVASRILGPHVKIKDICVGTDKFGHFFQQGFQYYEKARRTGSGVAAAEEFGRGTEIGMAGLKATGVFSNADLEANRQGLKFYDDLKASPTMTFDIAKYFSSKWNEQDNPSFYSSDAATTVWGNLLANYMWGGVFTGGVAGSSRIQILVDFTVTGVVVSGNYQYVSPSGNLVKGTITNGTITQVTTTVSGGGKTETPVKGIVLEFDWTQGGDSGKAKLTSKDERTLEGTWGSKSSNNDGGNWNLNRMI